MKKKTGRLFVIPSSMRNLRKHLANGLEGFLTIIVHVIKPYL